MIYETELHNLDIVGFMARVQYLFNCCCESCDDVLIEAWERMTTRGIVNEDGPGVYTLEDCDSTCTRELVR